MSARLPAKMFKTKAIADGFYQLEFRVQFIVLALAAFMKLTFGRDIVVTDTIRDPEKFPKSTHSYFRAADIRCNDWNSEEIAAGQRFLENVFYPAPLKAALVHGEDKNIHLHIQQPWNYADLKFDSHQTKSFWSDVENIKPEPAKE